MIWSLALNHPYEFETESETPLFLRDYLNNKGQDFRVLEPVMENEDAERLIELALEYKEWVVEYFRHLEQHNLN